MKGKNVTWIPGLDHAGIATQSVVERQLKKTLNVTRQDMSREEFLEHVWDWTNSNGGHIEKQIKSLGASLDWTRRFFTLDEARSEAVTEAFVRLYVVFEREAREFQTFHTFIIKISLASLTLTAR
jgi:valyl-tRNA synthetase